MSRNKWVVLGVCLAVGVACLAIAYSMPTPPTPVGANGEEVGADGISIKSLLTMLGGGSLVTALVPLLSKVKEILPLLSKMVPSGPAADTLEIVSASIAFASNPKDLQAQERFVHAAMAAMRDILLVRFPEMAGPLNALAVAIANCLYSPKAVSAPVVPGETT